MRKSVSVLLAAAVLGISGCKGGDGAAKGGAFSCAYIPGAVTGQFVSSTCSGCTSERYDAVADSDQESFAIVAVAVGQRTTRIRDNGAGPAFPVGSKGGALVSLGGNASASAVTFTTLMDDVPVETFSGAALTSTSTQGVTPASTYLSFTSTSPFNGLEMVINAAANTEYRVHEFCGDS